MRVCVRNTLTLTLERSLTPKILKSNVLHVSTKPHKAVVQYSPKVSNFPVD